MPSPVITSVAAAESPANSTGPWASTARSTRAGIGQASWRPSGVAPGPRAAAMCGRASSPAASVLGVLAAASAIAEHAEPDVGATVGQRERPGVAGEEVLVEPDDQLVGGDAGDAVDVLAEGMPLAEIAGGAEGERLARRAPHPVGGDDMTGDEVAEALDTDRGGLTVDSSRLDGVAEVNVGAGGDGEIDEGGVELQPWRHGGIDSGAGWERNLERVARRGAKHGAVDHLEVGHGGRVEAEVLELAQRQRRQPVATTLVAGELGLVDDDDVAAGAAQLDGRGDARWPGADDEDVDDHGRQPRNGPSSRCLSVER